MNNYSVEMIFFTDKFNELSLTIPYCSNSLEDEDIKTAMQGIIDSGILKSTKGLAIEPKQATYTMTTETVLV